MGANLANILGIKHSDEKFKDEKELKESKIPQIQDIPIELIDNFPDHPFKVRDDDDMSLLIANGTDPRTAASQLGHSSPALTMNVYANPQFNAKRKAGDLIGNIMGGKYQK